RRRCLRGGPVGGLPAGETGPRVAIDGKRLRGSRDGAVPGVHRVRADAGDAPAVRAQGPAGATHEAKAARTRLGRSPRDRGAVDGEAAVPRRDVGQAVVDGGGDYFRPVQDHQPELTAAIAAGFERAVSPGGPSGGRPMTWRRRRPRGTGGWSTGGGAARG